MSMASNHPGGVDAALAYGNARFLRDTIDCWSIDPGTAVAIGVPYNSDGTGRIFINPGTRVGVLQKLCTRNLGDSVGADSY